ncbi:PREDICTED: fer-1-like protein 6 isoform X1 [Papilio xuthus]|uniref:Fer-1-like protein 6 isoform X1 n=1 Tax=Papilio xuthus TaxID=66420 RepID=A0AAJ6ZUS6_PAPXU|nr:PREDICTED: fer-1-like protein 6 isoform X1 [Papilio xuthus]
MYKSMRSKSPEKSCLQKLAVHPTYRTETDYNPEATPQYFQVSVNVLEAKKLAWHNPQSANSYVIIVLNKKKHRTSIRKNMTEPSYRESFVFEMYTSIEEIRLMCLWLAVMEPRCCAPPRLLGEASVDLGSIWLQTHHQVFHKWAQLCSPRDPAAGPVGFLKVDISIIYRGELQLLPVIASNVEDREESLLLPIGSEQQRANFLITIYSAFGLPNGTHCHGDKRYGKPPSTFVKVAFCGLVAKTAIQQRSTQPMYCEQISMVELFPNMNQLIRFEVCAADGCFNKVLASTYLKLGQISHDGENGFLPTFGPSLLHMYGSACSNTVGVTSEDGPFHRGALLVSLKTIVPYYKQHLRATSVEPVGHIRPDNHWISGDYCVFCPLLEISMVDNDLVPKTCGVAISMGEVYCEQRADEEFLTLTEEIKHRKLYYTGYLDVTKSSTVYGHVEFPNAFPVLQLATRLPDFRFRMFRNNMINCIVQHIEATTRDIGERLESCDYTSPMDLLDQLSKVIDDTATGIVKFLEFIQYPSFSKNFSESALRHCGTELDMKQNDLQKEEMIKIHKNLMKRKESASEITLHSMDKLPKDSFIGTKKLVKILLTETKTLGQSMKNLICKTTEGWPDLVIWLLNGGNRVGFAKIPPADIIYSPIPEQSGKNCGKIQTIYLKPLKCPRHINTLPSSCYCIAAKLELITWMGTFRDKSSFDNFMPQGYKVRVKDHDMCVRASTMMVECRAFVYRAKISEANDSTPIHPFLRINFMNSVKETQVREKTTTPVWNQVLRIHRIQFANSHRLNISPPTVLVEVNNCDIEDKNELIGRFELTPVVDDRADYEYAPKLRWYNMAIGAEVTGQVLMSVQVLQVPEKLLKSTTYSPIEETFFASGVRDFDNVDAIEPLPNTLIPKYSTYKVDIYWWGLRDVTVTRKPCVVLEIEDLTLKSDIILDKRNSCNFPNGRCSHTFEAPLDDTHYPPLNIRLYDSSTFGRTLFFGTYVVRNPMKYYVNWLPQDEREASLRRASIMSSSFTEVRQSLYIRKSGPLIKESIETFSNIAIPVKSHVKPRKWTRLFSRREPDEEEYTLLPMFTSKEKNAVKEVPSTEYKDWWMRYLYSQQEGIGEDKVNAGDKITIYDSELELQSGFSKFKDWCSTLKLYNGNKTGIPEKDEQLHCGYLKAGIAIYKWPPPSTTVAVSPYGVELNKGYFNDHPNNEPATFLVRVYLVKAFNLISKDFTGKTNPYIVLTYGNKHVGDRNDHIPRTLNPIFGKMIEFSCSLPEDYLLTVALYDYDENQSDEMIGSTQIDLEDRVFTKHRARVGLSLEYNVMGPNKWRDCTKPSAILEDLCQRNYIPSPVYPDATTVLVNGVEYRDSEKEKVYASPVERKENICLTLLHNWHTLPICGYQLVPEHVETRTLYNTSKPGLEMGKLQMWIDIFPLDSNVCVPSPIDITPRKIEDFELRVVILNVNDLKFYDNEKKRSTDIYVRAWIGSVEQVQHTDVHSYYQSGVCNFNWRMIFNFQYQHAEGKLVIKEKGPFNEVEERIPPVLIVHVLDGEMTTSDDFLGNELGSLHLNLNCMPRGVNLAQLCTLDTMDKGKKISLFSLRTLRAWWPLKLIDRNTGNDKPAGSIELELTLLPKETAILMPLGIGRSCSFVPTICAAKKTRFSLICKNHSPKKKRPSCCWILVLLMFLGLISIVSLCFINLPEIIYDIFDY